MASVTLFIRKIQKDSSLEDIKAFIDSGIPVFWRLMFWRKCKISRAKVLTILDRRTMETEYHGLVTLEPDALADPIIKRLNMQYFKGRRVMVRRFCVRSARNDRRYKQDNKTINKFLDKRICDRRREELEILDTTDIKTKAVDGFYRRLI